MCKPPKAGGEGIDQRMAPAGGRRAWTLPAAAEELLPLDGDGHGRGADHARLDAELAQRVQPGPRVLEVEVGVLQRVRRPRNAARLLAALGVLLLEDFSLQE